MELWIIEPCTVGRCIGQMHTVTELAHVRQTLFCFLNNIFDKTNKNNMDSDFIREFDVDLLSKTLYLHQKLQGDVSCVVWDASIVLAKYLQKLCEERESCLKNVNVIELGAGVGCVGLTAACLGANVLLTDLPEALALLKLNVEINRTNWHFGGNARATSLSWSDKNIEIDFVPDLILLADCVYYEESIDCLVRTLKNLATLETKIILSQELRDTERQKACWEYFKTCVSEHFTIREVPLSEQNSEYCSPDIMVLEMRKISSISTKSALIL